MRVPSILRISDRTLVCAALASLVFFSRAWLIREWGSPLPFWDQWDAEVIGLYFPWVSKTLHWSDLFRAHNEHHILLTRLTDLALFVACDGWNPWAQMLLNAALHAATAAALAAIFWPALVRRERVTFLAGLAILFTATCGWQNALYGFQSQVYFANLFTVGVIAGLCGIPPFRASWWLGLAAAVPAFFSNGGGILSAAAALIVGLLFNWNCPRTRKTWIALGLIAATTAMAFLPGSSAPQHTPFHAQNVRQFLAVLTHCLAWPWVNQGACCLVMQLPLIWLVITRWRKREPLSAVERCALGLGVFAVLQATAIAITRGGVLPEARPLSRYQDPLLLGVAGQLFATTRIFSGHGRAGRLVGMIWCGVALGGLIGLTETNFTVHLPYKRAYDRANLAIVRAYATTGDAAAFTRDPNFSGPHPNSAVVRRVIDDPALRATLPASILATKSDSFTPLSWIIRHGSELTLVSGSFLLALLALLLRSKSERANPTVPAKPGAR